jgi:predicted nucleotidyltransferase
MNKEQTEEFINKHKVLECEIGSFVYGTNVETSDHDYCGIIVLPKEYYLGLDKLDEIDLSIVSKLESGKNDSDAVDRKFYNINKYISLAMDNNPNLLAESFLLMKLELKFSVTDICFLTLV